MSTVTRYIKLYAWRTKYDVIEVVEGDSNSRILYFQLFNTTMPIDLTNCVVMFFARKSDSTEVYTECGIIDSVNGMVNLTLPDQLSSAGCRAESWIQIIGSEGSDLRIEGPEIRVKSCDMTRSIMSADDFSLFLQKINELGQISNSINELKNSISNISKVLMSLDAQGPASHNSRYRGKYLGSSVTNDQYSVIYDGTFDDLYIGDYWIINDNIYRIAGFDYLMNLGDTKLTNHHIVVVPDSCLYTNAFNTTNITTGGYLGSSLYSTGLNSAKTIIKSAFGEHVLLHRLFLINAVSDGLPSGGAWTDSEVDLMCEEMVYGANIGSLASSVSSIKAVAEKTQLPLFLFNPVLISTGTDWWLRDTASGASFCCVRSSGEANMATASHAYGIRPYFIIG